MRSTDRSGHQPTRSARADGSSTPRSTSVRRRPPSASNSARMAARSSVALVAISSVSSPSSTGAAWTHRPLVSPMTPRPTSARHGGADDERRHAAGQVAAVLDAGDGAHAGVAAVLAAGDEQEGVARLGGRVGRRSRLVGLEGERHDHARQHHVVGERQDRQCDGVEIGHRAPFRQGGNGSTCVRQTTLGGSCRFPTQQTLTA